MTALILYGIGCGSPQQTKSQPEENQQPDKQHADQLAGNEKTQEASLSEFGERLERMTISGESIDPLFDQVGLVEKATAGLEEVDETKIGRLFSMTGPISIMLGPMRFIGIKKLQGSPWLVFRTRAFPMSLLVALEITTPRRLRRRSSPSTV